jgi:cytochrome c553
MQLDEKNMTNDVSRREERRDMNPPTHAATRSGSSVKPWRVAFDKMARMRATSLAAAAVLAALGSAASAQTPPDETSRRVAESLATNMCTTCHGPGGISSQPKVPRIGGQQRDYLEVQLKAFRNRSRGDPEAHEFMWSIASTLNDNVVAGLADYYARQPPGKGRTEGRDPKQIAAGEELYQRGDRTRGIAPCSACHGQKAEGMSVFPRLAGQHAFYLGTQMQAIQAKLRQSPVMHGVVKELTLDDIYMLSYYLESL